MLTHNVQRHLHSVIPSFCHPFILSSLLLVIVLTLWRGPVNLWSLQYWWAMNGQATMPGTALNSHAMAPIWQAEEELRFTRDDLRGTSVEDKYLVNPKSKIVHRFALRTNGNLAAAYGEMGKAIDFWVEAGDLQSLRRAGNQAQAEERWTEAEWVYEALHHMNPDQGTLLLINYLIQQGQVGRAKQILAQAIAQQPEARNHLAWLHRMAALHRAEENWQEAENVYRYALDAYPASTATTLALGALSQEQGLGVDAALSWYEVAAQQDRRSGHALYAGATLLHREQRYDEADHWYAQAIERQPQNQSWYVTRGNLLREAGELIQSIEVYQQAVGRFSSNAQVYYELAWAYRLAEQGEKALEAIERAIELVDGENRRFEERAVEIRMWMGE